MAFSVIIPLYNKLPYIGRALHSVLAQSVDDYEVIIVDDGSSDGSASIVDGFRDARLRLIRQNNAGVSAARNRGAAEARHATLAFLDADDEWKPRFLETILQLLQDYPDCGAYGTAYELCDPSGERATLPPMAGIPGPEWCGVIPNYFEAALYSYNPFCASSVAIPRHILEKVGGFPVGVSLGEDLDTWLRIALLHPVAYCSAPHALYHLDAGERACARQPNDGEPYLVQTARTALRYGSVPPALRGALAEYVAAHQLTVARQCIRTGKRARARQVLADCNTRRFRKQLLWWRFWALMPTPLFQTVMGARRSLPVADADRSTKRPVEVRHER